MSTGQNPWVDRSLDSVLDELLNRRMAVCDKGEGSGYRLHMTGFEMKDLAALIRRQAEEDRAAIREIREAADWLSWDAVYAAFKKHAPTIARAKAQQPGPHPA